MRKSEIVEVTEAMARTAQIELKRLGFFPGTFDGDWGSGSQKAMRAFQTGFELSVDGTLSSNAVEVLKVAGRGCATASPDVHARTSDPERPFATEKSRWITDFSPGRCFGELYEWVEYKGAMFLAGCEAGYPGGHPKVKIETDNWVRVQKHLISRGRPSGNFGTFDVGDFGRVSAYRLLGDGALGLVFKNAKGRFELRPLLHLQKSQTGSMIRAARRPITQSWSLNDGDPDACSD